DLDALEAPAYVPPPYVLPPTTGERLAGAWRRITATPARAALTTVDVVALAVLVIALRPMTVHAVDTRGSLTAHCGIGFYLFGHPNPVVAQACGRTYRGHADVAIAAGLVVVGVTIAQLFAVSARRPWARWVATPGRAAITALVGAAIVVGGLALRTIPVRTHDASGPFTAHCGLSFYVFGNTNPVVTDACRHAYGLRAGVLALAVVVVIAGVASIAVAARRS